MAFPLNLSATWPHHIYPNWIKGYWSRTSAPPGSGGNREIDYPISLAAISVVMPRRTLNLTRRVSVDNTTLGLKAFAAGESR